MGWAVDAAARVMAAGGRRRRPLRYQSLAALVEDSQWPFLFLVSDFSYGADDYDAEGNEEQKGPPEGSETMPYIDESPTMSPQLSARNQGGGDSISPTPPEGLAPAVGTRAFLSGFREERAFGQGGGRHRCHGPGSAWDTTWRAGLGTCGSGQCGCPYPRSPVLSPCQTRLLSHHLLLSLPPLQPSAPPPCWIPSPPLSVPLAGRGLKEGTVLLSGPWAGQWLRL